MTQTDITKVCRCNTCGHVGSRAFLPDEHGVWRDVLGGPIGVTPDACVCTYCDSDDLELVAADAR